MNKWISVFLIALIITSFTIPSNVSAQVEGVLLVKVVNPLGEELSGMEVLLVRGTETRRFVTNASGSAEFKHVAPGDYVVKVVLGGITLAEERIAIPEQTEVTLTAKIAFMKFTLTNLNGDPLSGLAVNLSSEGGLVFAGETDEGGVASFNQVPYSELEGVGEYNLTVTMGDLIIHEEEIKVAAPVVSKNISLPLLNVKITVRDLEGDPVPRITLTLSSSGYSEQKSSTNGTVIISNLPSSRIEGVGIYKLNVTRRTGAGDMLIHTEERAFTSSESIDIVTDLAKLTVKVVDDAGKPLESVKVVLSNELAEEFASAETDVNGAAAFEYVPLSFGEIPAGNYSVKVFRGDVLVGEMEFEVSKPRDGVELIAKRKSITIRLMDFNSAPLANYGVRIIDELSGEEFGSVTDSSGRVSFRLFFGTYDLRVLKDEREVYAELIDIQEESMDLNLAHINFPLKVVVKDALGSPLKSATVRISAETGVLREVKAGGVPLEVTLPYPTYLICDIYSPDGRLVQRSKFFADGPGVEEIYLKGYIEFNGLLSMESAALLVAAVVTAIIIASSLMVIRGRGKAKG